jgi:hypothetical protein
MVLEMYGHATLQIIGKKGEKGFDESRRFLEMLAGLWKFHLSVLAITEDLHPSIVAPVDVRIISYHSEDLKFEQKCARLLTANSTCRTLLFDSVPKKYGPEFRSLFGISGIQNFSSTGPCNVTTVGEDCLTTGLDGDLSLRLTVNEACGVIVTDCNSSLLVGPDSSCFLTKLDSYYCCSLPIWQIGVPSFPYLYNILRNFIFFASGVGHFSPYPYVTLRIDDYPLTSEQFLKSGGVSDEERSKEVKALCEWAKEFNAKLEFMVNSKVMEHGGTLTEIDHLVPKSVSTLRSYFEQGVVNINAHGRSHVDEECFRATGKVTPFEFSSLSPTETKEHLADCIDFIERQFGKKATGFVPPCWGYHEHCTKEQCGKLFCFVVDSAANYRTGNDWPEKGFFDNNGMLHLLENWHLGSRDFDHTNITTWKSYIDCGIPIQMMAHGLYLSDPVPSERWARLLVLGLYAALLPIITLLRPVELLRIARAVTTKRSWGRLGLLRKLLVSLPGFKNKSVRDLLQTGTELGAHWGFTEELAGHLQGYAGLTVNCYSLDGAFHRIEFTMKKDVVGPFLFHLSKTPVVAELDGKSITVATGSTAIELAGLKRGNHTLTVRMY